MLNQHEIMQTIQMIDHHHGYLPAVLRPQRPQAGL